MPCSSLHLFITVSVFVLFISLFLLVSVSFPVMVYLSVVASLFWFCSFFLLWCFGARGSCCGPDQRVLTLQGTEGPTQASEETDLATHNICSGKTPPKPEAVTQLNMWCATSEVHSCQRRGGDGDEPPFTQSGAHIPWLVASAEPKRSSC